MLAAQVRNEQAVSSARPGSGRGDEEEKGPRVDRLLRELLLPENRERLEQYRFHGSSNRVYKIPLDISTGDFIVVKLLPSRLSIARRRAKKLLRSFVYGEREVFTGKKRVKYEIERAREWLQEGLPVPRSIATTIPDVRVFEGLPFPTFFTILQDPNLPVESKLDILASVTRSLSFQHRTAWTRGKKSLIHPDPGPWNIMYDPDQKKVWWFDLEHPADYPGTSLETHTVRALRIYLYGVMDHLGGQFEKVMQIVAANYEMDAALLGLLHNMQKSKSSLLLRLGEAFGLKRGSTRRRRRIAAHLNTILPARATTPPQERSVIVPSLPSVANTPGRVMLGEKDRLLQ